MIEFSQEEIDNIRASLGVTDTPIDDGETTTTFPQPERNRRGGRARKSPLPTEDTVFEEQPITPVKLSKRDEREVAERLSKILTGGTGIASMAKPYLQMTDEEAKDISDPLASYLVRNADTIPIAGQILENYDLAAIVLGTMAYVVRVYNDRREEVYELRERSGTANPVKGSLMDRIAESQGGNNGRSEVEGNSTPVSTPYDAGGWTPPS